MKIRFATYLLVVLYLSGCAEAGDEHRGTERPAPLIDLRDELTAEYWGVSLSFWSVHNGREKLSPSLDVLYNDLHGENLPASALLGYFRLGTDGSVRNFSKKFDYTSIHGFRFYFSDHSFEYHYDRNAQCVTLTATDAAVAAENWISGQPMTVRFVESYRLGFDMPISDPMREAFGEDLDRYAIGVRVVWSALPPDMVLYLVHALPDE